MKKEDLKFGNIIELRDGRRYIKTCIERFEFICLDYINSTSTSFFSLNEFDDDLKGSNRTLDIMKVYEDYTGKKVLWERKEKPKLTEKERKILMGLKVGGFNWIVRNESGTLCAYENRPMKSIFDRQWLDRHSGDDLFLFSSTEILQFVKWNDIHPKNIDDLLKEEE